jgi:NAD/NADP transhydrogenase alpha subunit
MVPELVEKLTTLGYEVAVEPDAGRAAQMADEEYVEAGATVDEDAMVGAELVVSVQPLPNETIRRLPKGTATISFLPTNQEEDVVRDLRDCGITSFAMEFVPRISRAQSMDALSSQALVAGYRCAIVAAGMLRRFFPLSMTAAGTVQPATAAVPGRRAPMLVTQEMVEQMKPGSVVVDLAAETGGNVEGSVAGEVVRIGNAQVWGGRNVPSQMPGPASRLYAQNIVNLVELMTDEGQESDDESEGRPAAFAPDFDDEVVIGACVTRDGSIVHDGTREAIEGADPSTEGEASE